MDNFDEVYQIAVKKQISIINSNKEKLVLAWIAETGLIPSESVMCIRTDHEGDQIITRIWIEKRINNPVTGVCTNCTHSYFSHSKWEKHHCMARPGPDDSMCACNSYTEQVENTNEIMSDF